MTLVISREFDLIQRYFTMQPVKRNDVVLGIGDDCALLSTAQHKNNQLLAVSTDTLVAGVHFPMDTDPAAIGHKVLAVNLSDLAAMGAEPAWMMLSLTLPQVNEAWLTAFAQNFFALAQRYRVQLVGGDTTQGPLSITCQVFGWVPEGKALRRSGAKPGDKIYVTGCLGDAGLALQGLQTTSITSEQLALVRPQLDWPMPRVEQGLLLRGIASSAIDISDGLAADLGHILQASGVGATVELAHLPLSTTLRQAVSLEQAWELALSAGDDYELCFTVPAAAEKELQVAFANSAVTYQCIGVIESIPGLRLLDNQRQPYILDELGYSHFNK